MPFKKGQSGNPNGRPKGTDYQSQMKKALKRAEKRNKKKFWDHLFDRAFENDIVLVAVTKKLVPDLKQVEGTIKGELELIPVSPTEKLAYRKAAALLAEKTIEGDEDA